ncbi:hypothetical protein Tco_0371344 [Tanacetum coccineum]
MAPKRATRSNIALETTNITSVTNAQLQAMIIQGVTSALAARDANTNGVDSHNSGTGARRNKRATQASKPKTMQEATEMAIEVMDKRNRTFADRQIERKRKPDNNQQPQQHHQNKRQNTTRAYAAGTVEKKQYGDLNLYAQNAIITTMVHVLLNATNATKLAILLVTVEVRQMLTML